MNTPVARRRRNAELGLGILAILVTTSGYILTALADDPNIPADLWVILAALVGLMFVAHLAVRRLAPRAEPTLLPLAALLTGLGFVMITRLDKELARGQATWALVGVGAFIATLFVVRDVRVFERYRYTFLAAGIAALLLPLAPSPIGREINGARLWAKIGPFQVQPGEVAKVLLVVFFAAYLVDKRDLLTQGTLRLGRLRFPHPKHLGPLVVAWGTSLVVMVMQKDLGSSLLFFAIFAAMLYMATNRAMYIVGGSVLFFSTATLAYNLFDHVQVRVSTWTNPWLDAQGDGYQIVQSLFAFGTGGFAGTGLGLGSPQKIPYVATDFIFAAIGEELGLLGTASVIIAFLLLLGTGFRIAIVCPRPFSKLFAAGLTAVVGIQTFVIIGGVTRVIPLTGVTLPFVSYGGSSLVVNYIVLALLLRISDDSVEQLQNEHRMGQAQP